MNEQLTSDSTHPLIQPLPLASTLELLRAGSLTPRGEVDRALERAQQLEPQLRALLPESGRRDRLYADLERLEAQPSAGVLAGALVGVKDIIAVEGLPLRAGSALPPEAFSFTEGTAIRRLREAGALIFGKTVTTEFAYAEAGATANPHDLQRTPGGSSSGSAAAVAAGYVPLALGSQTVGSVLRPAAYCGIVGYKPTHGRAPLDGVVGYSPSVDHLGWFTQDVAGARIVASVILDSWQAPDATDEGAAIPIVGVPDGPYLQQTDPAALAVFEATISQLAGRGVEVRRVPCFEDIDAINQRHRWVSTWEFGEGHAERFEVYGALYRGESAALFDESRRITDEELAAGRAGIVELRDRLHRMMDEHGIDLWASPAATGPAPLGLAFTGDRAMSLPWTHAGVPAITVPAGALDGMPLGLQLAARSHADEALLTWAEQIELLLNA